MDATEKYTAGEIRQYTIQAVDFIIQNGTENTTDGKWRTAYSDVPQEVCPLDVHNIMFDLLARVLASRPEVVALSADGKGWNITYDPAYCVHCPETTPIQKEVAIDDELQKKLESVAAFIIEDGTGQTTSGAYTTRTVNIPADLLSPEMVEKYKDEIAGIIETYDAVSDVLVDEDGDFDVNYYLDYCPYYDPHEHEKEDFPPHREILNPLDRTQYEETQAMLAECRPALIPEKGVQHPPVYMATLPHAREHDELDAFKQSRELNNACAAEIEKAIHDSNYEPFHYDMEAAAKQVIAKFGMERTKIIAANTVKMRDGDMRFSSGTQAWAKSVTLPDTPASTRFDVFTNIHSTLLDSFITSLRRMEREAEKAPADKKTPSLLGQLKENKKAVAAKPPAKGKDKASTNDMEV